EMRALLRTLRGRTMLVSTHILSEASVLCSRIVILARGRLVAEDTPEGLARRLAGIGRVTARIEGPSDAVQAALAALPGVVRVEALDPDGQSGTCFAIFARDPEPVQRALGAAIVARGWTLLEVRASVPSLE